MLPCTLPSAPFLNICTSGSSHQMTQTIISTLTSTPPRLLKLWLEEYFVLSLLVGMAVSLTSCFLFSAICIFRHLSKRWSPILNTSTWAFPSDTGVGHASIIETSLSLSRNKFVTKLRFVALQPTSKSDKSAQSGTFPYQNEN